MKLILTIITFFILFACGGDYGNKLIGENLTIYFSDVKDESIAEKIAFLFKDEGLTTGAKQDVWLVRNENEGLELRIIVSNSLKEDDMPFSERKHLLEIQKGIKEELNIVAFEIVVCNNKFEPIYNIN